MPTITKTSPTNHKPAAKTGNVVDRIGPMDVPSGVKVLVYGNTGTGKTTLAASFPGKILWLICSGGKNPGELKSIDTPAYRKKIDSVVLESTADILQLASHVQSSEAYSTVVLDHVTGMQWLRVKEFLRLDGIPISGSAASMKAAGATLDKGVMSRNQWGDVNIQCIQAISPLIDLRGINVVILGQEREREPKEGSELVTATIGVALTPQFAGWLYTCVDYIIETCKLPNITLATSKLNGKDVVTERREKGVKYALRIGDSDVWTTKFRKPKGKEKPEFLYDDPHGHWESAYQKIKEFF